MATSLLGALVAGAAVPTSEAAGLNPLPPVARALASVTSYQVVVISSASGLPRRPAGVTPTPGARRRTGPPNGLGFGFGQGTRTIVAVKKGSLFEEYIVIQGKDRSGKATTSSVVTYGKKACTKAAGAKSYTCQTMTNQPNLDPTSAFEAGAGSTTFARSGSKTVGGASCLGYTYLNQSPTVIGKGVVYISAKTSLPCEQDASLTRKLATGGGSFTTTTKSVWSSFNDKHLSVPAISGL